MNDRDFMNDGLPLSRAESQAMLRKARIAPHGIILAPDDLRVGDLVAVYNLKNEPTELAPIMGQAITVTAIELPFLVGIPVSDPSKSPLTLDIRFLNFMRVSKEFAKAQTPRRTDD